MRARILALMAGGACGRVAFDEGMLVSTVTLTADNGYLVTAGTRDELALLDRIAVRPPD